jgi:hypothetical protein
MNDLGGFQTSQEPEALPIVAYVIETLIVSQCVVDGENLSSRGDLSRQVQLLE